MLLKTRVYWARGKLQLEKLRSAHAKKKDQRATFYRNYWQNAAAQLGASVELADGNFVIINHQGTKVKFWGNYTDLDGPATLRLVGDKRLAQQILKKHHLPIPESTSFRLDQLDQAHQFLKQMVSCVVKPASGSSAGQGVCTRVTNLAQLQKAAIAAAAYGENLIIEEQIFGRDLRFLFLDGQLLDIVERRPPRVFGDGKSTIGQLLRQMNKNRLAGGYDASQVLVSRTWELDNTLKSQGYRWSSVPDDGTAICIKSAVNENAAEDNVSVTSEVGEHLIAIARSASQVMGVRLAGVDILTKCTTEELDCAEGVILEVNTTPGLYIHRGKRGEEIGRAIVEACLRNQSLQPNHLVSS